MSERQIRDTPSAVTPALPGRLRHHHDRGPISPMNDAKARSHASLGRRPAVQSDGRPLPLSPRYGDDVRALREELGRVRELLRADS